MKRIVGIVGIIITITGWYVSKAEDFPSIHNMLCPDYANAKFACKKLHQKNAILTQNDKGFNQICSIIVENIATELNSNITSIQHLNSKSIMVNTGDGIENKKLLETQLFFDDRQPAMGKIYDLDLLIKERYLASVLLEWALRIFWAGIFISLIAVLFL